MDTATMGMVSWAAQGALTDPRGRNGVLSGVMFHLVITLRK